MKITRQGKLPEKRVYKASCTHCGTLFEFERSEARSSHDQRDPCLVIRCPLRGCDKDVYVNP